MDARMMDLLSQAYRLFCTTHDLPNNLSADELLAELPDGPEHQRHREWLSSFINLWDLSS